MAESLLRAPGGKFWAVGANALVGAGGGGRRRQGRGGREFRLPIPTRRNNAAKIIQCAAASPDDNEKKEQTLSQKLCAGLAATMLMVGSQGVSSLPWFGSWTGGGPTQVAQAAGLLSMPPQTLSNRYFLVRAGFSNFESMGVIRTNPVLKTSVDSGLSPEGLRQTIQAATKLQNLGACDKSCWIWPSITQRSYQAAELIAYVNNVNYSRIVPEFSFLDARGLGAYESRELSAITEIYSNDLQSPTRRPPKYTDGTPNESVADVLVRVTQLMSILETQYSGDTVIIVSPDSDNLSVLQAALTGQDISRHATLAFAPGEVRRVDKTDIPARRPLLSGKFKLNRTVPSE